MLMLLFCAVVCMSSRGGLFNTQKMYRKNSRKITTERLVELAGALVNTSDFYLRDVWVKTVSEHPLS
jgi:hypothetical protein